MTTDTLPIKPLYFTPAMPPVAPIHLERHQSTRIPGWRTRVLLVALRIARHAGWIDEYSISPSVLLKLPKRQHEIDEWGSISLYYWWGDVIVDTKGTMKRLHNRQPLTVAQQQRLSLWGKALDLIFGLSRVKPVAVILPPRRSEDEAASL